MKLIALAALICSGISFGQVKADSSGSVDHISYKDNIYKPNYKKLIVPTVLIGYGVVSLTSDAPQRPKQIHKI
jgi:hypothetical protein